MSISSSIQSLLRRLLPYRVYYLLFEVQGEIRSLELTTRRNREFVQRIAGSLVRERARDGTLGIGSSLRMHELSVYSQNGEDGILLYLFGVIGVTNKTFVEFGVEDGRECNSANLLVNLGWRGLLLDGSEENVKRGKAYYSRLLGGEAKRLSFVQAFVTAENINRVISEQGFEGEIDFLSVDIDGNDYWVWKAIDCISPRVVAIEYNASFGPKRRVTIEYDPGLVWRSKDFPALFHIGASLSLLNDLARDKGYVLIGCESNGINAFFVRRDVAEGRLEELAVIDAYFPHGPRTARFGLEGQEAGVEQLKLVEPSPKDMSVQRQRGNGSAQGSR